MRKLNKKYTILLSLILFFALSLTLYVFLFVQKSAVTELKVSNITSNSFYVTALYKNGKNFGTPSPAIKINGERVSECEEASPDKVCTSDIYEGNRFVHIKVNNVSPSSDIKVEWLDTWGTKTSVRLPESSLKLQTKALDERVPVLERVYGKVVDSYDVGIEGAYVFIQNDIEGLGNFSAVTNSEGAYSLSYIPISSENFPQEVYTLTPQGEEAHYATHNFYNKPVADIVFDSEGSEVESQISEDGSFDLVSLVTPSYAANSCITDTTKGGIRAQCNDKSPWVDILGTSTCVATEQRFRLGVVKHASTTKFHRPGHIVLKLYDPVSKTFIQDPLTKKDLSIKNGGYVDMSKITLEQGKTYDIRAFDGSKECINSDGQSPSVTIGAAAKPGSGSTSGNTTGGSSTSGSSSSGSTTSGTTGGSGNNGGNGNNGSDSGSTSGSIPPLTGSANLCKKVGENFAVSYPIAGDKISQASSIRMRWGLGLITGSDQIYEYAKSVSDANNLGVNMILRICYKGSCNVNSGAEYGGKIVEIYDHLARQGALPQNGLFVIAGHNEPNAAEYRDPQQEAQFVAEVIRVVDEAGILSKDMNDGKVKLIGPALDLYRTENGQWPGCSDGCDDPNPHPIYNAQTYIDEMLKNSQFSSVSTKLVGWAVNDYLDTRAGGADKVVKDVKNFTDGYLEPKGQSSMIFVTELGNYGPGPDFKPGYPWSDLGNTIAQLEAMDNVAAILLFNALGTNRDSNFSYHSDLWNNQGLIESLYSNCVAGSFSVPQEGSVPVKVERRTGGNSNAPRTSGSVGINGTFSGGAGLPGGSSHGSDPCLGGICYGNQFTNYAVAPGGLLNGNFEGQFVGDNNIDQQLYVPQYWHAWYQNKCQANMCGTYACSSADTICRRPEYKDSKGYANRVSDGSKSAQYFTSFGTHYAGLYQHVDLSQGGTNKISFSAKGSSWSDDNRCEGFGTPQCKQESNCKCEILNTFIGRIGIDPTGGIDPTSASIVWSEWKGLPNVGANDGASFTDFELVDVPSTSNRITLFVATNNEYPYRNSDSYWDEAILKVNGQVAIGQASSDPKNGEYKVPGSETCGPESKPGPDGEACWVGNKPSASLVGESSDSLVLGATTPGSITLPGRGEYKISSDQIGFEPQYISNFDKESVAIPVFQDLNGNNVHDETEFYIPSASPIKIEKVDDVMQIDLKPGLSIISLPLYTEDFNSAVKLVEEIAAQGGYATSIATYRNIGDNPGWNVYNQRGEQSYSDDFQFRPGDALYIVSQEELSLRMRGDLYEDPVQTYLKQGWNLISIKGSDKVYDSKILIEEINALPGVRARIVSVWDSERGRFTTYLYDESGEEYGEIMPLVEGVGVFVYIDRGLGYWVPKEK